MNSDCAPDDTLCFRSEPVTPEDAWFANIYQMPNVAQY